MPQRQPERGPPWLVISTYNEASTIESLVTAVRAQLPDSARILIVDNNSSDHTGRIADGLAGQCEQVRVLHRAINEGIGPSHLEGFRLALSEGAGLVLEMDADFSHDPAYIPHLLASTERFDVAIASRYVGKGSSDQRSALLRVISVGASMYARLVLRLDVRDPSSGFACFRREVLEEIGLDDVRSRGYAFQVELIYRAIQIGFRVTEVPVVFGVHYSGSSTMSSSVVLGAIWRIPLLRLWRTSGRRRR